jgi:hypothetical protein
MLVLPIAGAAQGRSEPPPGPPPVRLLAAGEPRLPGRTPEIPVSGRQTNRGESPPTPRNVASPSAFKTGGATPVRDDGPASTRKPTSPKFSVQPARALAPTARGAVEVSAGFAAWGALRPDGAPTPQSRTGGPLDQSDVAPTPHRPKPVAPMKKTRKRLGLVLLGGAVLASAVAMQVRLGRAMHAARIAAASAAPAVPATMPLAMTPEIDERAASAPGSLALAASSPFEPGASASEAAAPTALPAAPQTESSTAVPAQADRKRKPHVGGPHAASTPMDVTAAILAAQARADAFLKGRPASSVEPDPGR